MNTRLIIFVCPILTLLTQCTSSKPSSASLPLPQLSSPRRAQAWAAPEEIQTENGYALIFTNPHNEREKMTISGSREPMFTVTYPPNLKGTRMVNGVPTKISEPQLWEKTLVASQVVKWSQITLPSAERNSVFETLGMELQNSSGERGRYRITGEGTRKQMRTWLSELQFVQE